MTAAELLTRAEQRARTIRLSANAMKIIGALALAFLIHRHGVQSGKDQTELAQVNAALATNAKALAKAVAHRDSTKVEAVAQVARADTMRTATRRAEAPIHITSDSTVTIREAVPSVSGDTTPARADSVDVLAQLPPPVIAELRADRAQILQDSITIRAQSADIRALEMTDSLHIEREGELTHKVDVVGSSAFHRGVEVGVVVAVVAWRGAVWLFAHR